MDAVVKNDCEGCEKLAADVAELKLQLANLQDQLAMAKKNSATSSKPPSSDITNPPPRRTKPGRPPRKKRSTQSGHKRHKRKSFLDEQVDLIIEYRFDVCPCCGGSLSDQIETTKTLQSVEIVDPPIEVTEHRRIGQSGGGCGKTHHCPLSDDIRRAGLLDSNPASHDFFVRPAFGNPRLQATQHMQVIVHDRKSANRNRKVPRQQFQSLFDPRFAMLEPFATQERSPHAT